MVMESLENRILVHQVEGSDVFYVGFPLDDPGIRYEGTEAALGYLSFVKPNELGRGIDFNSVNPEVMDLFETRRKELVDRAFDSGLI